MPFKESVVEHASLPFHSSSLEALFVMVDILLRKAYSQHEMRNKCAASAFLRCDAPGWPSWETSVSFMEPAGTWERASAGVRSRLESDPPHIPVEDVTLTLSGLAGESGTQMGLLNDVRDDRRRRLVEVDRKLQPLMGGGPALHRIAEVAPWHPAPEMRALRVPVDPSGGDAVRPLHTPKPVEVREGNRARAGVGAHQGPLEAGVAHRRPVDVRPVVAPRAGGPRLLPGRLGRRREDHPVP